MTAMPAPPLSPEEIERLAIKRASAKMGWYIHACVFVSVNAFLYFSSTLGFRERHYNLYPMLGWGLGLAFHFLSVFVLGTGSGLRQSLVDRERERIQRDQRRP